jgi:hypothetical protein
MAFLITAIACRISPILPNYIFICNVLANSFLSGILIFENLKNIPENLQNARKYYNINLKFIRRCSNIEQKKWPSQQGRPKIGTRYSVVSLFIPTTPFMKRGNFHV